MICSSLNLDRFIVRPPRWWPDSTQIWRSSRGSRQYLYSPDRRAERPAAHLERFRGVVQVDGYPGFERLAVGGDIQLAACWAHVRRKFYDVHQATGSPIAAEALRRIGELYAIETSCRGQTAETRREVRQARSLPLVGAMKAWLEMEFARIAPRSGLADATRYALARWSALCRFLATMAASSSTTTPWSAPSGP